MLNILDQFHRKFSSIKFWLFTIFQELDILEEPMRAGSARKRAAAIMGDDKGITQQLQEILVGSGMLAQR